MLRQTARFAVVALMGHVEGVRLNNIALKDATTSPAPAITAPVVPIDGPAENPTEYFVCPYAEKPEAHEEAHPVEEPIAKKEEAHPAAKVEKKPEHHEDT